MNAKLRALVASVGVILAGVGGVTLYQALPGVTRADAIDAGIAEGTRVERLCAIVCERDGGRTYHRKRLAARYFPGADGGEAVLLGRIPDHCRIMETEQGLACRAGGALKLGAQVDDADEPEDCACSSGAACEMVGSDGGWVPAYLGNTLPEGRWRGAGCVRRSCVVLSHGASGQDEGWPEACPP